MYGNPEGRNFLWVRGPVLGVESRNETEKGPERGLVLTPGATSNEERSIFFFVFANQSGFRSTTSGVSQESFMVLFSDVLSPNLGRFTSLWHID